MNMRYYISIFFHMKLTKGCHQRWYFILKYMYSVCIEATTGQQNFTRVFMSGLFIARSVKLYDAMLSYIELCHCNGWTKIIFWTHKKLPIFFLIGEPWNVYRVLEKIDRFIKETPSAIITEFTTLIPIHMCIWKHEQMKLCSNQWYRNLFAEIKI